MTFPYNKSTLKANADVYCVNTDTTVTKQLGFGTQGVVFLTKRDTAIKIHALSAGYIRERDIYMRLRDCGVERILGMKIPRLRGWNDDLFVIEMSVVSIPCIIDFGGAYLDTMPDHMVRDDIWLEEKSEEFGDNWKNAQSVIRELEHRANIWLADVNTGNIKFAKNR